MQKHVINFTWPYTEVSHVQNLGQIPRRPHAHYVYMQLSGELQNIVSSYIMQIALEIIMLNCDFIVRLVLEPLLRLQFDDQTNWLHELQRWPVICGITSFGA